MSINFHPFFRELADRHLQVTVILKNAMELTGILDYVDSNLNMYLSEVDTALPQLQGVSSCFIRANTVKTVAMTQEQLNEELMEDLLKREGIKIS